MIFDYGMLLSPYPIKLSIGHLRKPTLGEIAQISFERYNTYRAFLKYTPRDYYTKLLKNNGGIEKWEAMPDDEKDKLTMYMLIKADIQLQKLYTDLLKFFFEENVVFKEGFFILFNGDVGQNRDVPLDQISGVISENDFQQVMVMIQQICCVYKPEDSVENNRFKNDLARKLFEKMRKAQKKQEEEQDQKPDKNLSIPNLISSIAAIHPSINLLNVWDLTLFQLMDYFKRMQTKLMYDITSTRVAVWGDEKKQFDPVLWHKNYFDT